MLFYCKLYNYIYESFSWGFTSKPAERASILLINGTALRGNLERFQYFNFETNFLKNESFFQKIEVPFFIWK